jgi:hypothetical protein
MTSRSSAARFVIAREKDLALRATTGWGQGDTAAITARRTAMSLVQKWRNAETERRHRADMTWAR